MFIITQTNKKIGVVIGQLTNFAPLLWNGLSIELRIIECTFSFDNKFKTCFIRIGIIHCCKHTLIHNQFILWYCKAMHVDLSYAKTFDVFIWPYSSSFLLIVFMKYSINLAVELTQALSVELQHCCTLAQYLRVDLFLHPCGPPLWIRA